MTTPRKKPSGNKAIPRSRATSVNHTTNSKREARKPQLKAMLAQATAENRPLQENPSAPLSPVSTNATSTGSSPRSSAAESLCALRYAPVVNQNTTLVSPITSPKILAGENPDLPPPLDEADYHASAFMPYQKDTRTSLNSKYASIFKPTTAPLVMNTNLTTKVEPKYATIKIRN